MKALNHLRTINRHKMVVMKHCFKVGLYKQGLLHDLSKYTPTEFLVGCRYFQGTRSPNNAEREATGYSSAWLHHKGRNKHHYEYWIDYSTTPGEGIVGLKMPTKYVVEMVMDRIAASKIYNGAAYTDRDPLNYYEKSAKQLGKMMHPETAELLHKTIQGLNSQAYTALLKASTFFLYFLYIHPPYTTEATQNAILPAYLHELSQSH